MGCLLQTGARLVGRQRGREGAPHRDAPVGRRRLPLPLLLKARPPRCWLFLSGYPGTEAVLGPRGRQAVRVGSFVHQCAASIPAAAFVDPAGVKEAFAQVAVPGWALGEDRSWGRPGRAWSRGQGPGSSPGGTRPNV